jgi:pimeloyl-ACP methyl ester carboxylesterase
MRAAGASKRLAPVSGGALWVEERGDGPPLLLVAGLGQGSWAWKDIVDALAAERRTITFDGRGTGRSSRPASRTIEEMATDVGDVLGGRTADVVGLSMGGYIALTLALAQPKLVRSLVLSGTGAGGLDRVPRPPEVRASFNAALGLPYDEFVRETLHWAFAPGWAEEHPERISEIVDARLAHPAGFHTLTAHVDACYAFYEAGCEVERIEVPALVVHGDLDRIVPVENGRTLAARLPNARYVELPGGGHNLPLEEPETFTRLVLDFLAEVSRLPR